MRKRHMPAFYFCGFFGICAAALAPREASPQSPQDDKGGKSPPIEKPLTYRVEKSNVVFYVEGNRQYLAAIDKEGKVLWHRSVVDQLRSKEWLGKPVRITFVGKAHDWMFEVMKERGKKGEYIGIAFSNREGGVIDQSDGSYTSMGND